ncbi:MAG: hypothetical protein OHK0039_21900 [Bacteroidia bacterium]
MYRHFAAALVLLACLAACQSPHPLERLLAPMAALPLPDTLLLAAPDTLSTQAVALPLAQVRAIFGDSVLASIDPAYDSTATTCHLLAHYRIDARREACVLLLTEHWFRHTALALYAPGTSDQATLWPVASFYGGDGGQTQTASCWTGDQLITRYASHWLVMPAADGEPTDHYADSVAMFGIDGLYMQPRPVADPGGVIGQLPLRW